MLNRDFTEYLRGKKVCVVGGAPYLTGTLAGEKIDSYDIVIRINSSGLYLKDYIRPDYGYKNNVFYCNDEDAMNGECEYEKLSKMNLDWIIFKSEKGYLNFQYKDLIKCTYVREGELNINTGDFMGLVVMNHLLYLGTSSEIYGTAFSFYSGDKFYCDHYGGLNPDQDPSTVHDVAKHRRDFLEFYNKGKILLDDYTISLIC
jgi:hypothetical protein